MDKEKFKKYLEERRIILDNGCWVLPNNRTRYPKIWFESKAYQLSKIVKLIYQNIEIKNLALHSCDNDRCWNPEHIFDGTHTDNINDSLAKGRSIPVGSRADRTKTKCLRGHEYNEQNTSYYRKRDGTLNKVCRICRQNNDIKRRKFQSGKHLDR